MKTPPFIPIKCASHRARQRAIGGLSCQCCLYFADFSTGPAHRGIYLVTPEELPIVLRVKGVTRLRARPEQLAPCWTSHPNEGAIEEARHRLQEMENFLQLTPPSLRRKTAK